MSSNWQYLYKLNASGERRETNLLYTPYVNKQKNLLKMHFCIDPDYRSNQPPKLRQDLIDWFFEREARFLTELQHLEQTPEIYEIDHKTRTIIIEWNYESLSHIVNDKHRDLDTEMPNWREELTNCINNFIDANFLKTTLYPHCFFISRNNKIKTIDYYAVVPFSERFVSFDKIKTIIGEQGSGRFTESTNDEGNVDFKKFFEITANQYLQDWWNDDIFAIILKELYFNDKLE